MKAEQYHWLIKMVLGPDGCTQVDLSLGSEGLQASPIDSMTEVGTGEDTDMLATQRCRKPYCPK